MDSDDLILPFGKHKGQTISEIPCEYLDWLIGQDWFLSKFADLLEPIGRRLEADPEWQRMGEE